MRNHKILSILIIIVLILGIVGYKFYEREHDQHVAKDVYAQMVQIDKHLDALKESALELHHEQDINTQIINRFNGINKDNLLEQKDSFITAVKQLTYDNVSESKIITIMTSATPQTFKNDRRKLKEVLRELKYNHNQHVKLFNDQITQITNQVKDITSEVSSIDSDHLQRLELARLKFISNKLSQTVTELSGSLWDKLLDEVIERDHIADKDTDGND